MRCVSVKLQAGIFALLSTLAFSSGANSSASIQEDVEVHDEECSNCQDGICRDTPPVVCEPSSGEPKLVKEWTIGYWKEAKQASGASFNPRRYCAFEVYTYYRRVKLTLCPTKSVIEALQPVYHREIAKKKPNGTPFCFQIGDLLVPNEYPRGYFGPRPRWEKNPLTGQYFFTGPPPGPVEEFEPAEWVGCNCWAYAVGVADVPMLPPVPPTAYPMGFPMDDDGNPEAGELVTPNGQPTGDNVYPADPKAHLHVLGEVAEGILKASGYYEVVECSLPINEPDLVVLIYSAGKNDDGTANCEDIQLRHGARSVGNNQYDTKNGFIFPPVEGMEGTNDGATGMLNGYFAPISLERNPRTGEMDRVGKVVCYKKR